MTKRIGYFVLILLFISGMLAFAGGEKEAGKEGPVKVRFVFPGNPEQEADIVQAEINRRLMEDGQNLELELVYIPWDVWDQKTNLMLTTGEEFELMHVMEDRHGFADYAGKGAIVSIDEYIDEYGPALKKVIPGWVWDTARIDGKITMIPAYRQSATTDRYYWTIRKDLLEENNLSIPTTPAELLDAAEIIKKNWKGDGEIYVPIRSNTDAFFFLHRSYDSFPFTVFQKLVRIDQDGKVSSWVETEEFKKDSEFFRDAFNRGLIHRDILGQPNDWAINQLMSASFAFQPGCPLNLWPKMKDNNPGMEIDDIVTVSFNPEKPTFSITAVGNDNVVPSTTSHPEAGVKYLNWVYSSQENYDLHFYGIEGRHWKKAPNHRRISILDPDRGQSNYRFREWMAGNVEYLRYEESAHPRFVELFSETPADTEYSITIGFNFNAVPVQAEYTSCLNEYNSSMVPIALGLIDYEENFPTSLKRLKAAGLDKVVAEYDKQFNSWMATK
ncbi:MAG: extracellular solute-binding protein [Spirochaetaceae bacterium]|nr:extracellular solute-binding protein [Spirochaetaceae bacterium]